MLKNALFGGVNAAVLTAMNADLSIDLDRMATHCGWLLANGCNGLAVLGTTGEANSLGIQERIELLRVHRERVRQAQLEQQECLNLLDAKIGHYCSSLAAAGQG